MGGATSGYSDRIHASHVDYSGCVELGTGAHGGRTTHEERDKNYRWSGVCVMVCRVYVHNESTAQIARRCRLLPHATCLTCLFSCAISCNGNPKWACYLSSVRVSIASLLILMTIPDADANSEISAGVKPKLPP